MQLGIALVGEHPPLEMAALIERVERLGFDMLWLTDERFHRDVFVNMTAAALKTERLRIGCMVTDPFIRHPALTAAAAATLDDLSGERFVLGLGAGISGFRELGIERVRPARAIREAVELIHRLSAGERNIAFEGELIRFGPGHLDFRPGRRTPVYVAGRGPHVLQAAGALADGVVVGSFASDEGIRWGLERARLGAETADRRLSDLDTVSWLYTSVAKDPEAARDAVRIGVAVAISGSYNILDRIGVKVPDAVRSRLDSGTYRFDREALAELGSMLPAELIDRFSVAGTVSDVVEKLARVRALGIGQAALWPFPPAGGDLRSTIDTLGTEVLPALRH